MFNFVAEPDLRGTWRDALSSAGIWLFSRPEAVPPKARKNIHPAQRSTQPSLPVVSRLSAVEQWERVAGVLTRSSGQASHARDLQGRASQQIDLATYAFNSIIDELATVMPLPSRRDLAKVHLFEPSLARTKERSAVAAYKAA